ncbi:hypothetical protein EDD85DRAFT_791980 [Armillaria nabsnona]|nr:hypothetical protein EDD85DRAFT_791980 [Armillaria nabsnona]
MKQGVLLPYCVCLLLLMVTLAIALVRWVRGSESLSMEIPGLTDTILPKRLSPKQVTNIHKMFNLSKEDDVCKCVIHCKVKSMEAHSHRATLMNSSHMKCKE